MDIYASDLQVLFPEENGMFTHAYTGQFIKTVHVITRENPMHKLESLNPTTASGTSSPFILRSNKYQQIKNANKQ